MSDLLSSSFTEHHVSSLPATLVPESWGLEKFGVFYQLDLKLCQLKTLDYGFHWGDERDPAPRLSSVLETPSRIIRLDVSLNELTSLSHDGLAPFRNMRALDASLNQIKYFQGIEVLRHLYSLNLSHNNIKNVDGLLNNRSLGELNLSNNFITDISAIPSLINLRTLNLSNNQLDNLEGASSFPKLEEIFVQHNKLTDVVPLTSCLHIRLINAGNNQVKSLDNVLRLITRLKELTVLNLAGNPVERDRTYQSDVLRAGNINVLDNVSVRPMPPPSVDHKRHSDNLYTLRDAAKQAFDDRMRVAKERMDENINFLQKRILGIQKEYRDFEQKLKVDLEGCLRYIDSLTEADIVGGPRDNIGATYGPLTNRSDRGLPLSNAWNGLAGPIMPQQSQRGQREPKEDYTRVKQTDELLRCAFKELVKQRDNNIDL